MISQGQIIKRARLHRAYSHETLVKIKDMEQEKENTLIVETPKFPNTVPQGPFPITQVILWFWIMNHQGMCNISQIQGAHTRAHGGLFYTPLVTGLKPSSGSIKPGVKYQFLLP